MFFYILFAIIIIPFSVIVNAFIINVQELFHGWKILSYLKYVQFLFNSREMRWKANEPRMDMGIVPEIRSLHQMCFSSQYYFAVLLNTTGIVLVMLAIEAMVRQVYNMCGDPLMPAIVFFTVVLCWVVHKLSIIAGNLLGLWTIENRKRMPIIESKEKKLTVPDWEEVERMQIQQQIQLDDEMRRIDTSRLLEEEFRRDFVKYNKQWIVKKLQQILSPRNVRRDRSRALAQLGRILLQQPPSAPGAPGAGNVSSDSSSADEFQERFKQFRFAEVAEIGYTFGAGWLAIARWRLKLIELAEEVAEEWLKSRFGCSRCGSFDNVVVEADPPFYHLVARYHHMVEITIPEAVDVEKWHNYLDARCEFRAVCKRCLEEAEALRDGFKKFSGNARKIAIMWLQVARNNITLRKRSPEFTAKLAVSDDDESDLETENLARTAAQDIVVDDVSQKLYQEWIDVARLIIYNRDEAKVLAEIQATKDMTVIEEEEEDQGDSSESDYEFAGLEATQNNVVGEVSELTQHMIDIWIDLARLQIYAIREEERIQKEEAEAEAAAAAAAAAAEAEAARQEQMRRGPGRRGGRGRGVGRAPSAAVQRSPAKK